jgi:DNA-directed RNA polymerase specialized sigma subunit
MENHSKEIDSYEDSSINFSDSIKRLNQLLKESLSDTHYQVYTMLFFEERTEEEVAKFMGYKTNEKNRAAGYKQIKNLKKMLKLKAQKIISENDILL